MIAGRFDELFAEMASTSIRRIRKGVALDTRADGTQGYLADIAACRRIPAWLLEIVGVTLLEESFDP